MRFSDLRSHMAQKWQSRAVDISSFAGKKIFLYGAGNLGKKLKTALEAAGIHIKGMIDRRAADLRAQGFDALTLEETASMPKEQSVVLLAALFSLEEEPRLRDALAKAGFSCVFALHELDWRSFDSAAFCRNIFIGDYDIEREFARDEDDVLTAYELWQTQAERDYYMTHIEAYLRGDFSIFPAPLPLRLQYAAHDVPEKADMHFFVDCGAFDGDTLRALSAAGREMHDYFAFEPQQELVTRIHAAAEELAIPRAVIVPCGVSSTTQQIRFGAAEEGKSAVKRDAAGENVIQCTALDTMLAGTPPTFIKMDIEGMEIEALRGAQKLIREHHPQLAICVYHDMSHIWRIPLLLREFYGGYRFYLRNYQYMGLETVVYAFADGE